MRTFLRKFGMSVVTVIQVIKLPILLLTWLCLTWLAWVAAFGGYLFDFSTFQWKLEQGGFFWLCVFLLALDIAARWIIDILFGIITIPFLLLAEIPDKQSPHIATQPVNKPKEPVFVTTTSYVGDLVAYQIEKEELKVPTNSECPNCRELTLVKIVPWECPRCGTHVASI
jgi:ribosomal protein S27AE